MLTQFSEQTNPSEISEIISGATERRRDSSGLTNAARVPAAKTKPTQHSLIGAARQIHASKWVATRYTSAAEPTTAPLRNIERSIANQLTTRSAQPTRIAIPANKRSFPSQKCCRSGRGLTGVNATTSNHRSNK